MVVRFSQGHGGMDRKDLFFSPLMMEEGGLGGGRGAVMPASANKKTFIEYYQQLNLDRYLQAERRQASRGCMASAWRVISFFLVVFVLPTVLISLPLYARYHLYHTRHLPMTETDTRALNDAVSSFWCQGQRVSSNGTLDAYLVSGTPKLKEERRHVILKRTLTLQHDDIEYWGVYLLKGSTFTVSSNARWPGGVLLVAKGEDNLRKCFYREERLEAELNEAPHKTIHRSPPDGDNAQGEMAVEEEHHSDAGDTGGGEVFDSKEEEEEEVLMADLGTKPRVEDEDEDEVPEVEVVPHNKLGLQNKGSEAPRRRNGKSRKGGKKSKRRHNKNETHHKHRSKRSEAVITSPPSSTPQAHPSHPSSSSSSPPHALPPLSPGKLDILHHFNDTLQVTTGNSSFSSSEEFLEQCKDSLLVVDLQPSLDWEWRLNTNNIEAANTWTVPVDSTDYYYFIFTSDNSIELNHLGFRLDLHRATYDTNSPLDTCHNASECVFPLAFTQTESVVVEVPAGEQLQELHSFEVTTACQPRVPVYMVFILLVPFIILLFAFQ